MLLSIIISSLILHGLAFQRSLTNIMASSHMSSLSKDNMLHSMKDSPDVGIPYHILGLGVAGLDYIMTVDKYPELDEKVRASKYTITGGGNVANTLTATSRLSISSTIYSIVGNDSTADTILEELRKDGVKTNYCVHSTLSGSAVTHVIVDDETISRTCIHVPMTTEISPDDVNQFIQLIDTKAIDDIDLIHFDSRQTLAAIALASYANFVKIPTSIDIEKYRPHVISLLPLCDIIFTNKYFPSLHYQTTQNSAQPIIAVSEVPSDENLLLHVSSMLLTSGWRARVIVTTLGSSGAILMRRANDSLTDLRCVKAHRSSKVGVDDNPIPAPILLQELLGRVTELTVNSFNYQAIGGVDVQVFRCTTWPLHASEVVDSTGAGDAFIGGFLAAFVQGFNEQACLRLASLVAAQKMKGVGSRSKLPHLSEVLSLLNSKISTK